MSMIQRMIPGRLKSVLKRLFFRRTPERPLPEKRYASRHRVIDDAAKSSLEQSIKTNYHSGWRSPDHYSDEAYKKDLEDHLFRRLELDRSELVPWLDSIRPLDKLKILEIGCGTGSSTIALAEQGALVTGVDIDQGALMVAKDRCKAYRVAADILPMNAVEIDTVFKGTTFDVVIFFACLEHMTVPERLEALAKAWTMLPAGGMLGVIETPNRLWYYDLHTSFLPFFHWLPDDLAFRYSQLSPRENFNNLYREWNAVNAAHFLRRGRGVSYHEFDLSIQMVHNLAIAGSLAEFRAAHGFFSRNRTDKAYINILHQQCPSVPLPFLEKQLDFVIRKA